MLYKADRQRLQAWIQETQLANVNYFRVRRDQWDSFVAILRESVGVQPRDAVSLSSEVFTVLKLALTSRNDGFSDSARLALEKTLNDLSVACERGQQRGIVAGAMGALGLQ